MSDSNHPSGFSPLVKTIRLLVGVALLLLVVQVWLNDPRDRPEVACWVPYKVFRFFGVTVMQIVLPREHVFVLRTSRVTTRFYAGCIDLADGLPAFHD